MKYYYFADHTFLKHYFYVSRKDPEGLENHGKATSILKSLPSLSIATTNFELNRMINNIFRDSRDNLKLTRDVLNKFFSSGLFKWFPVTKELFNKSLAEFRDSQHTLTAEFLDLTSFVFIREYKERFKGVLAFHDHFREASALYEFQMLC